MTKFVLSTDTCCDEFKSKLKETDISYIKMVFINGENVYSDDYDSTKDYLNFFDMIKNGKIFTTSGLNHAEVETYFNDLLKKYKKDIVHITLSSGLSVTYNVVKSVADEINATSENKIYVLDSLSATQGQNYILNFAKKFRDEEINANEAFEKLTEIARNLDVAFFVTDIDCLKRGGRINAAQAVMAKMVSLRPFIKFSKEGELKVVQKLVGTKKAYAALISNVRTYHNIIKNYPIYIAYTNNIELAEELKQDISKLFPNTEIQMGFIGPVIGSHTGENALGIITSK